MVGKEKRHSVELAHKRPGRALREDVQEREHAEDGRVRRVHVCVLALRPQARVRVPVLAWSGLVGAWVFWEGWGGCVFYCQNTRIWFVDYGS